MEGGVGLLLLLIIAIVAVVLGVAMYVTGGAILFGSDKRKRPERGKIEPVEENTTRMRTGDEPAEREEPVSRRG